MSGVAVAVGVGAAAGGAYAASQKADAAEEAAETRARSSRKAQDVQERMFNRRMALQRPFREVGYEALPELEEAAYGDVSAMEQMGPEQRQAYNRLRGREGQFENFYEGPHQELYNELGELARAPLSGVREEINQELAARGMTRSTPGMENLARGMGRERYRRLGQQYNRLNDRRTMLNQMQNMAGQRYNMLQGARQNRFNRLSQLANVGQGATAQTSQAAGQFAGNMSNLYQQTGQAQAQNALRQGNIRSRTISNVSSMPMRLYSMNQMNKAAGGSGIF